MELAGLAAEHDVHFSVRAGYTRSSKSTISRWQPAHLLLLLVRSDLLARGEQRADHMDNAVVGVDIRLQDLDVFDQHAAFRRSDVELRPLERLQLLLLMSWSNGILPSTT